MGPLEQKQQNHLEVRCILSVGWFSPLLFSLFCEKVPGCSRPRNQQNWVITVDNTVLPVYLFNNVKQEKQFPISPSQPTGNVLWLLFWFTPSCRPSGEDLMYLTPVCKKRWGEKLSWGWQFPEALVMSLVLPYVAWTVSAATEGTENGGEALKCECKWWIQDSCGTYFMLQTAMVWGSSQPRWSLPVWMGFTSWAIFRLRQSMTIISSLPFSGASLPITAVVEKETETGLWWLDIIVVVC